MPNKFGEEGIENEGNLNESEYVTTTKEKVPHSPSGGSRIQRSLSVEAVSSLGDRVLTQFFDDPAEDINPLKKLIREELRRLITRHTNMPQSAKDAYQLRYGKVNKISELSRLIREDIHILFDHCNKKKGKDVDTLNRQYYDYMLIDGLLENVVDKHSKIQNSNLLNRTANLKEKETQGTRRLVYEKGTLAQTRAEISVMRFAWGDEDDDTQLNLYRQKFKELGARFIFPRTIEFQELLKAQSRSPTTVPLLRT